MEIIGYFSSILIGISLGLIGGGGSILSVPILVYLFQIEPQLASSYSLCIVGITACIGSLKHYKLGNLEFKSAIYFAIPSVVSLLIIRKFVVPIIPKHICNIGTFSVSSNILFMVIFAILMMAASLSMIRKTKPVLSTNQQQYRRLFFMGIYVGCVSGFLGAGGGFLIIPALVLFAGLPMKKAIGTSLLIIFINSIIGFTGDIINGVHINYLFLGTITAIAILGMWIGTYLSTKIDGAKLKPAFGWFLLCMGIYIVLKEILF